MNRQQLVACAFICCMQTLPAFGQDAILPQGDPRLRDDTREAQEREAIRDSRLMQQGQGPNYRIDGSLQRGETGTTAGDVNGFARQDTGLSDPSVNPGQASGMRVVQGRVTQATAEAIVVKDTRGNETTMAIDKATAGDRDVRPGDHIRGTVTAQGRAVAIHKESAR